MKYLRIIVSCCLSLLLSVLAQPLVHAANTDKTQQFLSFADLHFDPFLACDTRPCPLIQKLQQAPVSEWNAIFSQTNTSAIEYGKDSSYFLLESFLASAKKEAAKAKVQFALVIGDFLAHNFDIKYRHYSGDKTKAGYAAFVKKTLEFLSGEFNRSFPHTDLYFAVGNNDSYQGDYYSDPKGPFFKDLAALESSMIKNQPNKTEMLKSIDQGGYYAVNAPGQAGLRLIVLNSVLFSTKAQGPELDQAAKEQLAWLHQQLLMAGKNKQQVLIAMHIPLGIDVYRSLLNPFRLVEFWKTPYSQQFLNEIQQASSLIMGVFPAHIHADTFQILTAGNTSIPFSGTPSISPIFGNNPGFKIYSYSLPSLRLVDFVTYYYSLNDKSEWEKEYDFDEVYQLNHRDSDLIAGMSHLAPQGEMADRYKSYYAVSNDSQPITKRNKWLPYYWCAIRGLTADEYQDCLDASSN